MKRPLKVLSASLTFILAGQLLLGTVQAAETPSSNAGSSKLVEWSNEDVKAYYDPQVDWSLPIPSDKGLAAPTPTPTPSTTGGSTAPIIVNQVSGGGFGWDDLLLYHLIFNTVSPYSSSSWGNNHRSYYYRSNTPYVNKSYQPSSFTNRSTTKTPTTSSGSGTFTSNSNKSSTTTKSSTSGSSVSGSSTSGSKSTSTSSGSIGGKSSGFSSSSSSSSGG
ncbi:hypothetical protein ASG89_01900 [Paenibacillus sp. Soil766]|uniref:hypothetical protein n=1 Tax=Paenibacillus sp. Soil766 TaxID=1736404 RepID=UPI000710353F|nr:hypothetical protein [Paenibacillus sp. Soil766]KRF03545.1 hypothetical protein ASG89_01900 [Paenibacillus sp. Soil766]